MSATDLHFETMTAAGADVRNWALVLHGVFGSGRNWMSVMRQVVERRPEIGALLVDLPAHRQSSHVTATTLDSAASLLRQFADEIDGRITALIGHSLGGKIGLRYAAAGAPDLQQLWVIDATPDPHPSAGESQRVLATLRDAPGPFATRDEAVAVLRDAGFSQQIAAWLATSLARSDGGFRWRFDLDAIESLLGDFVSTDLWHVVERPPEGVRLRVIRAAESPYVSDEACARIEKAAAETGRVHLHCVEGGHWLNADNPDALIELLVEHL